MSTFTNLVLAGLITTAAGHGFITSPKPRMPGTAMAKACGNQVEVNQASDNYGNIQGMLQVAKSQTDYDDAACNIWQCKGFKLADNTANVQSFTAGQVVPITVDIRAPHTGVANVSIVETATNTVIGEPLKSWDVYGSTASTIPADEKQFSITIPSDLGSKCGTAGDCVVQWYWNAASIDQTYESCIDFTVGGSGSDDTPVSPPSASSAAPVVTSAAAPIIPSSSNAAVTTSASQITAVDVATTLSTVIVTSAPASSAVEAEITAIPSDLLTSVLPTTLPTSTGSGVPTKALPEGTTLKDLLTWLQTMLSDILGN